MQYLIALLEGIVTFVSPCLLPMLPVYILYFGGQPTSQQTNQSNDSTPPPDAAPSSTDNQKSDIVPSNSDTDATAKANKKKPDSVAENALGFVFGFTIVFVLMGAFAGGIGSLIRQHQNIVNIVAGAIVVLFGLNYLGLLKIRFLNNSHTLTTNVRPTGFFSAVLFGIIFSLGWTPCLSAFLGSALLLASQQSTALEGSLLLLTYSVGLGIPFFLSAILIDKVKSLLAFVKKHYKTINLVCGIFLVAIGVLMMTGLMSKLLSSIS